MGFKPRPPPTPPPASPGNIKRGFVEKRVSSSPGFLRRKSSVSKEPETIRKSNSWWNLDDAQEDGGRRSSVRSSKCKSSSVPQSPSTGSRKSASTRASSTRAPPSTTPKNSTRKIQFRHKVFCKGQVLYEWEQNPKFVTIYYPTPNADYKAFCNIASGHVQLGTKPKGLPTKWFLSHDTGGKVDVESSDWKQCKQHCRIILAKDNKGSTWSRAIRDDRVDQTTTIKKSRPKVDRTESEPAMMSPTESTSTKKKWKNPRRWSAANLSDDDENSEMGSEELEGAPNKRTSRGPSSKATMSRTSAASEEKQRRRSSSKSSKEQQRSRSKNQVPPQRTRSISSAATSEKPMSTIFVEKESPMPSKRRSTSQSGAVPPRRSNSGRSTNSDKPMSTIFVEKESSPKMSPKRRSASQSKQPRSRSSKNGTAPPKRRMSSRSFDSIDEELPLNNIEVDMNSDLVSVL